MKMKKAFTLVELLVVISIIALLLVVLIPALNKARVQAKKVVCASHLHQTGVALGSYAAGNSNKYPLFVAPSFWSMGGLGYNEYYYTGTGNTVKWYPAGPGALFAGGYIKDAHFFFCPATKKGDYGAPFYYEHYWKYFYDQMVANPALQWGEFGGPFAGYCYWVGYKTNVPASGKYDKILKTVVAKDSFSGAGKVLMTDVISTEDPLPGGSYNNRYANIDRLPILANHVTSTRLTGGSKLYGDGGVKWQSFGPLMKEPATYLRCYLGTTVYSSYTDRQTGVSFWF
jgi:prepilin-type N-terminal cleavage/methylation domain-containing protein